VLLGISLVAAGVGLLLLGKPNTDPRPRFLRSSTASEMYAVLIVTVIALGVAYIFNALVK
jgi:hypothetical protein